MLNYKYFKEYLMENLNNRYQDHGDDFVQNHADEHFDAGYGNNEVMTDEDAIERKKVLYILIYIHKLL